MSIRITNKIMQTNAMSNINMNKTLEDTLNTQMATGKKITRPSDDPVVAIRSLRLGTNVTKLEQYNEKNAKDAEKWMNVTEDAIDNVTSIINDMYGQCQRGAGDDMNTTNLQALIQQLKSLKDEVYATGNADYAGRNLFTGFRTESNLTFDTDTKLKCEISEVLKASDIKTLVNVETKDLLEYSEQSGFTADETDIDTNEYARIRLSYDNIDEATGAKLTYTDKLGNTNTLSFSPAKSTDPGVYSDGADHFLFDTGELILSEATKAKLMDLPLGTEFAVDYTKSEWSKGDLRPEHYFDCQIEGKDVKGDPIMIEYKSGSEQDIYYDLGSNQKLKVNTNASEVFTHDIGRDVDDLEVMVEELAKIDSIVSSLEKKLDTLSGTDLDAAKLQYDAAKKAQTLMKDQVQKRFSSAITSMQNYQDMADLALTNTGARGARLDLIKNRLESSQGTFEELLNDNDQKDIEKTATELASAALAYEASLTATSKIMSTNLMDYI
ncbi:MAG: hypothetical protein KBS85_01670 [Lachnospiraceae bacterium]|nr:hypothetical protein [Candidatus Merdinaster equi]